MVIRVQDKNRDIMVAFPDVDPAVISVLHESYNDYWKSESRRTALEEIMDSFDPPHLWYSTSQVIHALELFIASGDELSEGNNYRLACFLMLKVFHTILGPMSVGVKLFHAILGPLFCYTNLLIF